MVTFAQAQERAEEWINGDVPAYQQREVRVREFELGFVVWAEDREGGPRPDGGAQRLVIARDSGEATLWPALPVGEIIRRYEEEYGRAEQAAEAAPKPPARVDLNQTSFLLTPPQWLQEAADRMGIPDRRGASGASDTPSAPSTPSAPAVPVGATPWTGTDTSVDVEDDRSVPLPDTVYSPALSETDDTPPPPTVAPDAKTTLMEGGSQLPRTRLAPAIDAPDAPDAPGGTGGGGAPAGAGASGAPQDTPPPAPPRTLPGPGTPPPPPSGKPQDAAASTPPPAPGAGEAAGSAAGRTPPPPPGAPTPAGGTPAGGTPAGGAPTPPPPGAPGAAGGYVPTQLVSSLGPDGPGGAGGPTPPPPGAPNPPGGTGGTPPGGVHHAATMLADPGRTGGGTPPPPPSAPPGAPGAPGAPRPPGSPGAVHRAETMLAAPPPGVPGAPPPPPGAPGVPPGAVPPPGPPPAPGHSLPGQPLAPGQPPSAYGYPQQGQPMVGPGYQAVLRYRAQDGSEQQLIRRSAPGMPHPEWQIFHELRAMNVPPDQVLELHTELESCQLPGAYCARMIREQWPQARITSIAPYGTDHASRRQGIEQLLAHQGELHQVADGPARPAPVRAPLPPVQPAPPIPPEGIAHELGAAFGPGVFRFDQAAVSRQGVPPIVAHTLVVAGLPVDMGPFFWAQAQPGRPVPTLAELAAERGVQAAPDAGSYLVVGSDFGKAICVQYGTANIVAVPVEAGPGGAPVPPQFVNTGLPEFVRCLALLGRMWRLRYGLTQEQAGRWTVDFQAQLASLDPAALSSPESWWSVVLEQMWDGLL